MITTKEKGCVYFFRHIGLTPVKVGYTNNQSPINRFEQFKTYAPYGSELLGFIISENAKELETQLHKKFSRDRLKGEWFELTEIEVKNTISFYSNIEDIEEKNRFEIEYAKSKISKNIEVPFLDRFNNLYSNDFIENSTMVKKTTLDLCNEFSIDKQNLRKLLKYLKIKCVVYKDENNKTISGYCLYKK
jgi:hypothetical protein